MNKKRTILYGFVFIFHLAYASVSVDMKLYAGSDATVKSIAPDSNFGADSNIQWSCTSNAPYSGVKSYFRFRLPEGVAGNIASATLRLTRSVVGPWTTYPKLYVLKDDAVAQEWDESAITWNNAPANKKTDYGFDTNQATLITQGTLYGTKTGHTNGEVWAVSNGVASVLNADSDRWVTFMVEWGGSPYGTGEYFATRENATLKGAVLEITYTAAEYTDVKTLATQRWNAWRNKQTRFPLAAWSYFSRYAGTQQEYQIYKDAGLNMVQSPYGQCNTATNVANLNLLLGSWEGLWSNPSKLTHYIEFPKPDSQQVAGYILYDEPPATNFDKLAAATELIYRLDDRDALPIVDHLPNWAVTYDRFGLGATNGTFYETYINKFVDDVSPCVMLNCHYPILADGSDRPEYYSNIEFFRKLALENNIGLMGFALVNGHQSYREPSESDLNWMVYSYLAYGAQGIFYWNYRIDPVDSFGEGLVTHSNGTPRTVYYMAQAVNAELDNLWSVLKHLKSTAVFHIGPVVPNGTRQYTNGAVAAMTAISGTNCIIGNFINMDDPGDTNQYVMLVNKNHGSNVDSRTAASAVTFTADSHYPYISVISTLTGEETLLGADQGVYRLTLGGGKGILLKFSRQIPSVISITPVLDTYIHKGSPTVDFGSSAGLIAQNSTAFPDRNRKIYMKYTLPVSDRRADGAALEITPSLIYNTNWFWTYKVYGLNDSAAGNNWTEITWNNAPANDPNNGYAFTSDATDVLGQFSGGGLTGTARMVTSPALNDFIRSDQDGIITLMIVRSSDSTANDTWAACESVGFVPPRLKLTYSPFTTWALGYGLYGSDADPNVDPDGDSAFNFYEFAFGGNPTNANLSGSSITGRMIRDAEATLMELVYARRIGDGLVYTIEQSTNLVSGEWTTSGWVEVGAGDIDGQMESVTNRNLLNDRLPARFFRVRAHDQ